MKNYIDKIICCHANSDKLPKIILLIKKSAACHSTQRISKNDYRLYIPPIARARLSQPTIHKGDKFTHTNQISKPERNAFIINRKPFIDEDACISQEKESFPYAGSLIMARFFFIYFYLCQVSNHNVLSLRTKTSWRLAMVFLITTDKPLLLPWRVRLANKNKHGIATNRNTATSHMWISIHKSRPVMDDNHSKKFRYVNISRPDCNHNRAVLYYYFYHFGAPSYKVKKMRAAGWNTTLRNTVMVAAIIYACCTHHKKHRGGGVLHIAGSLNIEGPTAFLSKSFRLIAYSLIWFLEKRFMWDDRPVSRDISSLCHSGKICRTNGNGCPTDRVVFDISFYQTNPPTYAVHAEGDYISLLNDTIFSPIGNHSCVYRSFIIWVIKTLFYYNTGIGSESGCEHGSIDIMIPHAHTLLLALVHLLIIYFITSSVSLLTIDNKKTNSPTASCEHNRALRIPRWALDSLSSAILSGKHDIYGIHELYSIYGLFEINIVSPIRKKRVVYCRYVSQSTKWNRIPPKTYYINRLSKRLSFYRYRIEPPEFTKRSELRGCGYLH